jgi:5-aminolevulinate synthase
MSKLQVLARRCPVMGKAMAVQSARLGHAGGFTGVAAKATMSTLPGHSKTGKAKLHTSRAQEAQAVDTPVLGGREKGELQYPGHAKFLLLLTPPGLQSSYLQASRPSSMSAP